MDSSSHCRRDFASAKVPDAHRFFSHYMDRLRHRGLSAGLISERGNAARHLCFWLDANALEIGAVDARVANRFLNHDCACPAPYRFKGHRGQLRGSLLYPFFRFVVEATGRDPLPAEVATGIELLERFLVRLVKQGHLPATVQQYRGKCRHFIVWLYLARIPLSEADETVRGRFLNHDCGCARPVFFRKPGNYTASGANGYQLERFVEFLVGEGIVEAKARPPRREEPGKHLTAFLDWLRRHRGVGEQTVNNHSRFVSALLPDLGADPGQYDAAAVRDALLRRLETVSRSQARNLASSLRMYLRYLASAGFCPPGLVGAVPTVPDRPHTRLPRYVAGEVIERSIASCDVTTSIGLRDRAVLLLLARLALRAGDVVKLRLTDIDWNEATVRVAGKSRTRTALPLPQDVGVALKDYILHARPRVAQEKVFLRSVAPRHLPFSDSGAVSSIARRALERAGVESVGPLGAHTFRHSTATSLLRGGAPLEVIGALLRHSTPKTTAIYAKVDVAMLHEVVQPWPVPGGAK